MPHQNVTYMLILSRHAVRRHQIAWRLTKNWWAGPGHGGDRATVGMGLATPDRGGELATVVSALRQAADDLEREWGATPG